jgi:hypothetical protein
MSSYTINDKIYLKDGNLGIGTNNPQGVIDLSQRSDGILIPSGTSLQRPLFPSIGLLRYNTTTSTLEIYTSSWTSIDSSRTLLTSITPNLLPTTGSTATVTGNGFVVGMTFQLLSRTGVFINIPTWTLNSSTSVTITRPDISQNIQPYSLVATLPSSESFILDAYIIVAPEYTPYGSLPYFTSGVPSDVSGNTASAAIVRNYAFNVISPLGYNLTWTVIPTTYGNIDQSGNLTITFPQSTSASGTFEVRATNAYGYSSQIWNYNVTDVQTPKQYPPQALTQGASGTSTTISGAAYGNGTYVVTSNNEWTNGYASHAFDYDLTTTSGWYHSATNNWNSTGTYTGSATTTHASGSVSGDWITIQMPSIVLTSYTIVGRVDNNLYQYRTPRDFWILGSTNGTSWTVIDTRSGILWTGGTTQTFNVTNSTSYSYYRMVVNRIGSFASSADQVTWNMQEWILFGI